MLRIGRVLVQARNFHGTVVEIWQISDLLDSRNTLELEIRVNRMMLIRLRYDLFATDLGFSPLVCLIIVKCLKEEQRASVYLTALLLVRATRIL